MLRMWQLPEAESQFGEVVDEAISHGPQLITKRGAEAAILLSYTEYCKLVVKQQKLSAFFHESPLAEAAPDLRRDASGPQNYSGGLVKRPAARSVCGSDCCR
jgi:antitoxin Phd